jgi:hypothetical protein
VQPESPAPGRPAPEVDDAFARALARDAAVQPPEMPAPPRVAQSADPDAPHGRDDAGEPLMPFGPRADGKPRLKPAGPGRGHKGADQPRETAAAAAVTPTGKRAPADYREDLAGLGMTLWMGGAALPATRPYAHLFKQSMPGMVESWNQAAQQNAAVRGWVEKLAGDGSWAWVIGVTVTTVPFAAACWELARKEKDAARAEQKKAYKQQLAQACKTELDQYITAQFATLGAEQPMAEAA